jgi:hypothetical protein
MLEFESYLTAFEVANEQWGGKDNITDAQANYLNAMGVLPEDMEGLHECASLLLNMLAMHTNSKVATLFHITHLLYLISFICICHNRLV